jgi:hypothetical protein
MPVLAAALERINMVAVAVVAVVVAEEPVLTARLLEEMVFLAAVEVEVEPNKDLITVILMAHLLMGVLVVKMVVFVLFGPVLHDHSHQPILETCDETLYSHC